MAGFNYVKSKATAARLLAKFGQKGALLRMTLGTGSGNKPGKPTYPATPVDLVVLDYSDDQRDGVRVTMKDRLIYLSTSGLSFEPSIKDRIRDAAGIEYEIIPPIKPLNPGGTVVFYEVQGRV